jgi:hypothetical protein
MNFYFCGGLRCALKYASAKAVRGPMSDAELAEDAVTFEVPEFCGACRCASSS